MKELSLTVSGPRTAEAMIVFTHRTVLDSKIVLYFLPVLVSSAA
jgi:hypothetical protein